MGARSEPSTENGFGKAKNVRLFPANGSLWTFTLDNLLQLRIRIETLTLNISDSYRERKILFLLNKQEEKKKFTHLRKTTSGTLRVRDKNQLNCFNSSVC